MSLSEIIIQKIKDEGPISFRDYMELCLYHPMGYYRSARTKIGRDGDFFTSPAITPVFGMLLTKQLIEIWKILGGESFTVMEWGGGNGALADTIVKSAAAHAEFYENLNYGIIEKNEPPLNGPGNKVQWYLRESDIVPFEGCILSNELIDNLPVHLVEMKKGLKEVFVDFRNGFREVLFPASENLVTYFDAANIQLADGYRTEVNLDARRWLQSASEKLARGFMITIDYGSQAEEIYHPRKNRGSLLCFCRHQLVENPYINIGKQDITSHVNFSALNCWGQQLGLQTTGYVNQLNFLRALGFNQFLPELEQNQKQFSTGNWMLHHFIIEMGTRIKVLVQHKGLDSPKLSGLQFGHSIREAIYS